MDVDEAREFCARWLPAWTGNRPESLAEFYAPEAVYVDPARPGGLHGRPEILAYFRRLLAKNPAWTWAVMEIFPTPKGFVLKWRATVPTPQGPVECLGVDLLELQEGRIVRNEVYFDRTPLMPKTRHVADR